MTTEQLVRKCFCPDNIRNDLTKTLYRTVLTRITPSDVLFLARAARRFVKMENERKGVMTTKTLYCARCYKFSTCSLKGDTIKGCSGFVSKTDKRKYCRYCHELLIKQSYGFKCSFCGFKYGKDGK